MIFQLRTSWPIGQFLIPAGTQLDLSAGKSEAELSDWEKLALGHVPGPETIIPLDDEARALMEWTHPTRAHPSRDALPDVLRGFEFKFDGDRIVGWRRKTS